jgi:putative phage-type endonuclease
MHHKVKTLLSKPQLKQKSPEWFLARKTKITASEVASCLINNEINFSVYREQLSGFYLLNKDPSISSSQFLLDKAAFIKKYIKLDNKCSNPYKCRDQFIIDKCSDESAYKDTPTTLWGKQYEDIACRFYSLLTKEHINEFGLVNHYRNKWLAASPDGITDTGRMLEIKCPLKRTIVKSYVPFYYFVQTQIQMECCNLDVCDYLECKIEEITKAQFWNNEVSIKEGVLIKKEHDQYIYPPNDILTKNDFTIWLSKPENNFPESNLIYYSITDYQLLNIPRSKEWYNNIKDPLKNNWDKIQLFQSEKGKNAFKTFKKEYYDKLYSSSISHWNTSTLCESLLYFPEYEELSDDEECDSVSCNSMCIDESLVVDTCVDNSMCIDESLVVETCVDNSMCIDESLVVETCVDNSMCIDESLFVNEM